MSSQESCLKISIITPCINRVDFIDDAINSVKQQHYREVEHIILDGGSTDGTLEKLERHPDLLVHSEPDRGLYDALNKGLKFATGDIIGWLNSDDTFNSGVFASIANYFTTQPDLKAVFGSAEIEVENIKQKRIRIPSIRPGELLDRVSLDSISMNACFFRRDVFDILGGFNLEYPVTADRDFMFRFGLNNLPYLSQDVSIYTYRSHKNSLTFGDRYQTKCQANLDEMNMALDHFRSLSSPQQKHICIKWHTRASVDCFLLSTFNKDWTLAKKVAAAGIRIDQSWIITMAKLLFISMGRRYASPGLRSHFSWLRKYLMRSIS